MPSLDKKIKKFPKGVVKKYLESAGANSFNLSAAVLLCYCYLQKLNSDSLLPFVVV